MKQSLELAAPFSDHCVLQRDRPIRIWGWDLPARQVRVALLGETRLASASSTSGADGSFSCMLPALAAGGPYRLEVEGSSYIVLEDVLVGEVWLASGQSNMEWTVAQADYAEETIASANSARIRCLKMPRASAREAQVRAAASWEPLLRESVASVSAVAYAFACELERELGVPIGIIDAAYGGTRVEAWTSEAALGRELDLSAELRRFYPPAAEREALEAEYRARLLAWEKEQLPDDPGNRGEALGYAATDFDDSGWRSLMAPGTWQGAGMRFNGVVWYRRAVDVPAAWQGVAAILSLGVIDDFDHSYVNGALVGAHPKGTPEAYKIERRYRLAPGALRAGRNLIAVRVFDHFGEGGFLSPSHLLYLENAETGERIALAGEWRAGVEHEIPLVPGSVFATYPGPPDPLNLQNAPAGLFNGMLAPLIPLGLAGILFYQGESNVDEHASYARRFRALVRDLRTRFGQGQLPFLFAQLAAFEASPNWPRLREAQAQLLDEPETGMVCTLDIGARHDIHPRNKREVGRRFALLALNQCYGRAGLLAQGPALAKVRIQGDECSLEFRHADGLTTSDAEPPRGFELAAADGRFVTARARIEGKRVLLSSNDVREPVAVRYAFSDYPEVNLVNAAGLPALPFRSDGF